MGCHGQASPHRVPRSGESASLPVLYILWSYTGSLRRLRLSVAPDSDVESACVTFYGRTRAASGDSGCPWHPIAVLNRLRSDILYSQNKGKRGKARGK
jgi:hypothetical protein